MLQVLDAFHHGSVEGYPSVTAIIAESKQLQEFQELFEMYVSDYLVLTRCSEELLHLKGLWDMVSCHTSLHCLYGRQSAAATVVATFGWCGHETSLCTTRFPWRCWLAAGGRGDVHLQRLAQDSLGQDQCRLAGRGGQEAAERSQDPQQSCKCRQSWAELVVLGCQQC